MAPLIKYLKVLGKRIYRPIKPLANPLLKKIKLIYLLIVLLIIGGVGNYQYWVEKKEYEEALRQKTIIDNCRPLRLLVKQSINILILFF
ncbi:hypothetical protein L6272_04245, partial [Microgenomates group bacterium]|nr:hypothetical protein [Microgenomates group bacterium]